ncbi:MAG: DUF2147 domain-containing protein [Bacteroidota bacterium]
MKKIVLFISLCCLTGFVSAKTNPDDIIGVWLSANGQAHLQIYKEADKYFGKLVWLKEPNNAKGTPKMDANNPDEQLRTKPLLGLVILRNFKYDDDEWSGGRVYDPQNGKDYKCYMKLKDPKTLNVRGYIGFSLLGRTEVWTRVK